MNDLLICSDIQGTISALSLKELLELLESIEGLKESGKYDKVIFSFFSTLSCEEIAAYEEKTVRFLIEKFNLDIEIGPHFGCNGYVHNHSVFNLADNTKGMQIVHMIDDIGKDNVKDIIYMDDNPNLNPIFLIAHMKKNNIKVQIITKKNTFNILRKKFADKIEKNNIKLKIFEYPSNDFTIKGIKEIDGILEQEKTK